jgi:hypothetical protein
MSRTYTTQDKVQFISAADTIHDFYDKMSSIQLFKLYIQQMITNGYFQPFGVNIQNNSIRNASDIEGNVLKFLQIYDDNDALENIDAEVIYLNFNNFEKEYSERMRGNNINKPFCLVVDNFKDEKFKALFARLCSAAYANNNPNGYNDIRFMTDSCLIKDNTLCSLKIKHIDGTVAREGKILVTEATKFDTGLDAGNDESSESDNNDETNTCNKQYHNVNTCLSRADGNLFGIDALSVGKTDETENLVYSYIYNNQVINPPNKIELADYIKYQSYSSSGLKIRRRTFFETIMLKLDEGKLKKRGRDDDDTSIDLPYLLNVLYKVYGLDKDRFILNNTQDVIQFMHILFDFKRAGDQLQSKAAMYTNSVFLSSDKLSIAYAQLMNVPCVKTTKFYGRTDRSERSKRKLVFYNFSPDRIINQLLNKRLYYKDLLNSYLIQIENVINGFSVFQANLNAMLAGNELTKERLVQKLDVMLQVSSRILMTDYYAEVNRNSRRESTTNSSRVASDVADDANTRAYQYKYVLQYNIFMCLLLKYLLSVNLQSEIYTEGYIQEVKNFTNTIDVSNTTPLTEQESQMYDNLVNAYQNDFVLKFLLFMKLIPSSANSIHLVNILYAYYSSNSAFYNDLSSFDTQKFNEYMNMIQKSMHVTNIPIISDYVKILKTKWLPSKLYPLRFVSEYIHDVVVKCKFVYFNRTTQEWNACHNAILNNLTEYEHILSNISSTSIDISRISRQLDIQQQRGGAIPPSRSRKSPSVSIISEIYKQLSVKHPTFYDTFMEEMKQSSEKAAKKAVANKPDKFFDNLNIDELYGKSDISSYKHFIKDLYELIAIFIVNHFGIFDEYGNISKKYRIYDELLEDISPSMSMKETYVSSSMNNKPLTPIKEKSSSSMNNKPLTMKANSKK